MHKKPLEQDFKLLGYTKIVGVQAWENDTSTWENHDKFNKNF